MTTLNISLPETLREYVDGQVQARGYSSASEYVRELIRLDQQRRADYQQRLEDLRRDIQVGIDQIERGDVAPLDIEAIKAEGRRRLAARQGK